MRIRTTIVATGVAEREWTAEELGKAPLEYVKDLKTRDNGNVFDNENLYGELEAIGENEGLNFNEYRVEAIDDNGNVILSRNLLAS